ncbi:MAG: 30S ribosomal protein S17 [Methylovulum sp.]|jgi:small subunit ribosomal protein S17|nr:30S ribosomal protein S17 [Methylovulum sp.]
MSEKSSGSRCVLGKVVSNKMDKSITVLVERVVKHPVYGKYIRRSTKMMAHDENNQCNEGDIVTIASCRPMSKFKSFVLVEIIDSSLK